MKKHLLTTLIVLAACAVVAASQRPLWRDFAFAEDGFAVSAPTQPVQQTQSTETAVGQMQMHTFTIDLGNDTGLMISATDFGKKGENTPPKAALQGAKNGSVKEVNGRLVSEKEISLDGNQGIEVEIAAAAYHTRSRYYFVKGKLFMLMSIAPSGKPFSPLTDRIFDSFRLLKPKE